MDAFTLPTDSIQLIPQETIDTFATYIMISSVVSLILFGLFIVFYIINQVRRWKVDSAILDMRKELREIKAHIVLSEAGVPTAPEAVVAQQPLDHRDPVA